MLVIVPHNIEVKDTALLYITGGDNNIDDDGHVDPTSQEALLLSNIAVNNKMVTASLWQIPNQPIEFRDDPQPAARKEDGIIALTWWHYLNDPVPDAEYLLRLPMTKGAVKAMDTITSFLTDENAPEEIHALDLNPVKYFVAGASKRGWTTWTTAAVDPRVIGALPIVMDELNFVENIKHHYMSYGGWSFALEDYWVLNLTTQFTNPKMQDMCNIVDAFEHRDKMLMPKYVVNAANDEFFLPTDTRYFWEQMPNYEDLNRFILLPNTEHSMITGLLGNSHVLKLFYESMFTEILPTVNAWMAQILAADQMRTRMKFGEGVLKPYKTIEERNVATMEMMEFSNIPKFSWDIDPDNGDITVSSEEQPLAVNVWHASTCTPERRDWRIVNLDEPCECGFAVPGEDLCANLGALWASDPLQETEPGSKTWVAHFRPRTDGRYRAFYVSLSFNSTSTSSYEWPLGHEGVMDFTTTVSVVPNDFPFPDCFGEECMGKLL